MSLQTSTDLSEPFYRLSPIPVPVSFDAHKIHYGGTFYMKNYTKVLKVVYAEIDKW